MEFRYHCDPDNDLPHIFGHGITEAEVEQVMRGRGDDYAADRTSRMKVGQTAEGRYLQVIYVPDEDQNGIFVITAYDLKARARRPSVGANGEDTDEKKAKTKTAARLD
jgi:hypothetical protein